MKRILFIFFITCTLHGVHGQTKHVDSLAIYILDRMSASVQNLSSCSFVTNTSYDVWQQDVGYVKHSSTDKVYLKFPDKLRVNLWGDRGHRSLFFDGNRFNYYSYSKNQYSEVDFTGTVVQLIDTINHMYGIEFPAADFFYPAFLDDLLDTGGNLVYLGISSVNDKLCYHVAGNDVNGTVFQFWITQDDHFLPVKMVLVYKDTDGQPQYEAIYSGWEMNPHLNDSLFEFIPPPASNAVKMNPVNK